jgi:hypothetical protein
MLCAVHGNLVPSRWHRWISFRLSSNQHIVHKIRPWIRAVEQETQPREGLVELWTVFIPARSPQVRRIRAKASVGASQVSGGASLAWYLRITRDLDTRTCITSAYFSTTFPVRRQRAVPLGRAALCVPSGAVHPTEGSVAERARSPVNWIGVYKWKMTN